MSQRSWLKTALFALVAIVIAVLRGWNVCFRGILDHDEGHALLNANTWHEVMRWVIAGGLWNHDGPTIAQLRDALHQQGGTLYSSGKFGYSLIVALAALPGQVTWGEGIWLAWGCGVAVCALAGVLAWQYSRNWFAAGVAALGCAGSPLLGDLSREVSGTIWALLFGLMAACAMQAGAESKSGRRRWLWGIAGGLWLGYGFTCHFNLAPFILALFIAMGLYGSRGARGKGRVFEFIRAVLPAALASLGVLLVFEAATRVVDYRLRNAFPEYLPFSEELHYLFFRGQVPMLHGEMHGDGATGWGAAAWAVYLHAAWKEGLVWIALTIAGLVTAFTARKKGAGSYGRVLILLFVPLAFWVAWVYRVERVMGMVVAVSWVLVGIAAGSWWEQLRSRTAESVRMLALSLICAVHLVLISGGWNELFRQQSPIPRVTSDTLEYVKVHGGQITAGSFDVGFAPLWKWSMVEQMREEQNGTIRANVDFSRFEGADIVFIDPFTWNRPGEDFTISKDDALRSEIISRVSSVSPRWVIESRDLTSKN